jgi:hypothetical protein
VGDCLTDERGRRRMGGHSSRVTGARHLTRNGVEVYIVQLLARHSTSIILHYVKDIPLEAITEHYGRGKQNRDLDTMLTDLDKGKSELSNAIVDMKMEVNEVLSLEQDLRRQVQEVVSQETQNFIVNEDGVGGRHIHHKAAIYNKHMLPYLWQTKCGWYFGSSRKTRWEQNLPMNSRSICDRCSPLEHKAALTRESALTSGPQGPTPPSKLKGPPGSTGPQGPKVTAGTAFDDVTSEDSSI